MRKTVVFLFCLLVMLTTTTTSYANRNLPTKTKATKEAILEDAVIDLLAPQMYSAIDDHYGTRVGIAFSCERVINIKKLDHPGSLMFEAEVEGITYKGAHDYRDVFTIRIKKDLETDGKWVMQDYKVRKVTPRDISECRDPA